MQVEQELCQGCAACIDVCPTGALQMIDNTAHIDPDMCTECYACLDACPAGAIVSNSPRSIISHKPNTLQAQPTIIETAAIEKQTSGISGGAFLLALLGERILPRLIDLTFNILERRTVFSAAPHQSDTIRQNASRPAGPMMSRSGGRGRRRRQRYGRLSNSKSYNSTKERR